MRFGVRIGACGTLGSLPRLGGRGSRGKPLHISFKVDILLRIFCHTLEQRSGDQTGDGQATVTPATNDVYGEEDFDNYM